MSLALDSNLELQLTRYLSALSEYKATDLHLSVGNPPSLRVGTQIIPLTDEALLTEDFIATIVQAIFTEAELAQLQQHRSVLSVKALKAKSRYRIQAYFQNTLLSLSFRYLPPVIKSLENLPFPSAVQQLSQLRDGLVIVTGPYGSGKSTLLAGCIEQLNQTTQKHIITFEQPIELLFNDARSIIEQREVGRDIPDITTALEFITNQDIDVVLVSNALSATQFWAAWQMARLGPLVYLETSFTTVASCLEGIVGLYPQTEQANVLRQLAETVRAVVALKALPSVSGGIAIASEVLINTPVAQKLILSGDFSALPNLIENGSEDGMLSWNEAEAFLEDSGLINRHIS